MVDINSFSIEELEYIRKMLNDKNIQNDLLVKLERIKIDGIDIIPSNYQSNRLPNYNRMYTRQVNSLLLTLKLSQFSFLNDSCLDGVGNNKNKYFYQDILYYLNLGDNHYLKERYNMLKNVQVDKNVFDSIAYMDMMFQSIDLQLEYEGAFNTINFVKNSLYKWLLERERFFPNSLFFLDEFNDKKECAKEYFSEAVKFLWEERKKVPNSRLSVSNHGLTKYINKKGDNFTESQMALVDAIAFSCSINEMLEENFEGVKRLIYVPYSNLKK